MPNIKCRFCGNIILDTDTVCKHCGRVLGMPASVRTVNNSAGVRTQRSAPTATPVKVIPDAMPEKKSNIMGGLVSELSGKIIGLSLIGCIYAFASFLAELVQLSRISEDSLGAGIGLLIAYVLLTNIRTLIRFCRVKKFIRKNGYENAIRNDTSNIANALAAYRLNPSGWMVRYIKKLNTASGEIIASVLKRQKKERSKTRLSYIPYLLIMAGCFAYLGYLGMFRTIEPLAMFIAMHILAFLANLIYCKIKGKDWGLKNYTVILFFAALMAFTDVSYGYHILICIAAVLIGGKIGEKMHK